MKKVFTILFLFTCLKFSVAAPCTNSLRHIKNAFKIATAPLTQDSSKTKSSKDTIKVAGTDKKQDSVVVLAVAQPADEVNQKQAKTSAAANENWFYSMPTVTFVKVVAPPVTATAPEPEDNNPPITSLIQLDSLKNAMVLEHIQEENLRKLILRNEQIKLARILQINDLDSLKLELKTATVDTIRALLYSRIAAKYIDDDTLSDPNKLFRYQNAAINYTILAIHEYSLYNDSVGLRDSYTNLSKVYYAQRKYTEAKWFILQSNTLSRARKDTPNVISSLIKLAAIKSEIKDYTLAMGDLNEALQLSINNHTPKTELDVLKSFALLYSNQQDYPKEEAVLKRRDSLVDSLRRADEAQLARAAALKKKQDALTKKKQYLASLKKPSKTTSQPKVASL
jgi:tetratricopeptide (TPR) repeat protein